MRSANTLSQSEWSPGRPAASPTKKLRAMSTWTPPNSKSHMPRSGFRNPSWLQAMNTATGTDKRSKRSSMRARTSRDRAFHGLSPIRAWLLKTQIA
jgi:hypothetical protein